MNQTVTYALPRGNYNKKDGIANVPFSAQQGTSTQMYIFDQSTMLDFIAINVLFFNSYVNNSTADVINVFSELSYLTASNKVTFLRKLVFNLPAGDMICNARLRILFRFLSKISYGFYFELAF